MWPLLHYSNNLPVDELEVTFEVEPAEDFSDSAPSADFSKQIKFWDRLNLVTIEL